MGTFADRPWMDLHWWETGAAIGSQLSVLALIAAAADPATCEGRVRAIERAYFPWIGALSTLLDSVVISTPTGRRTSGA